jgi:S1-C subfamily serine protease
MKKILSVLLLLSTLIGTASCSQSIDQTLLKTQKSTVQIFANDEMGASYGTGFVIGEDDVYFYILTDRHVVISNDYENIAPELFVQGLVFKDDVVIKTGTNIDLYLVAMSDPNMDLALLKAKKIYFDNQTRLKLATKLPKLGETVYYCGTYDAFQAIFSKGIIAKYFTINNFLVMTTDTTCIPGCSGGVIINEHGECVGIAQRKITTMNNIAFSMPVTYIRSWLKEIKYDYLLQ